MVRKLSTRRKNGEFYTNYLMETEDDLRNFAGNMGDVAYVIHTGEHWMSDSEHVWYTLSSGSSSGGKDPISCDCVEEMTIWSDLKE